MGKSKESAESVPEKLSRFGRNFNVAVGAAALVGAAVIPGPNVVIASYGWFNMTQAGGFELLRRHAKRKKEQGRDSKTVSFK